MAPPPDRQTTGQAPLRARTRGALTTRATKGDDLAFWSRRPPHAEIDRLTTLLGEVSAKLESVEHRLSAQTRELREATVAGLSRVTPFGCPMPDGTMLVQTVHGNRYLIDPLDCVMGPEIIVHRQWEADIGALLLSAARRDLVFADVGANFGYFTCLMGSRIGSGGGGRVFSIEPNPACAALLRRNVEINWSMCRIDVFECAVGDKSARLKLFVPAHHSANGYLGDADNLDWTNFPSHEVDIRPLDDLIPADVRLDLMKVDVEGHEYAVFAGARRVLARSPDVRIVMEWSPGQMIRAGHSPEVMRRQIRECGLRAYRLASSFAPEALREGELSDDQLASLAYCNIILTR